MIGVTNALKDEFKHSHDPHTLLLLTDDIVDRSMYNHGLYTVGLPKTYELLLRDNRNCIRFYNSNCLYSLKTDWIPSTTDWTLECWSYHTASSDGAYFWLGHGSYCGILWGYSAVSNVLYMGNTTGESWNLVSNATVHNASYNTWSHKALVHYGNDLLAFTDGVLTWSTTITSSWNWTGTAYIGLFYSTAETNRYIKGFLLDFRISDVARYTTNFTPPQRFL